MAGCRAKWRGIIQLVLIMGAISASEEGDNFRQCSLTSATTASRRFCYALYKVAAGISSPRRNILLSPIAAGMSLSMLIAGATDNTRKQMMQALEQSGTSDSSIDADCVLSAYQGVRFNSQFLFKSATEEADTARLRTATRIFGEQNLTFSDEFVEKTGCYGLEMAVVPFTTNPKEAERRINVWVRKQTQGNIRHMIKPGTTSSNVFLVLTSSMYFKAIWATAFTDSPEGYFYIYNGRRRKARYMESQGPLKYISSSILKAELTEIPYASPDGSNIDASLILILPFKNTTCKEVEKRLTDEAVTELLSRNASDHISVQIPKFSLSGEQNLKLFMRRLGVRLVFSPSNARMQPAVLEENDKHPKVFVSSLYHKNRFQIDEYGTQAEAQHRNGTDTDSQTHGKRILKHNRPFIFLLYDKFTESIIYAGRMADPTRKNVG